MRKKIAPIAGIIVSLTIGPLAWGQGAVEQKTVEGRHRVVMHLNSADENVQKGALNNIKHLYQELGGDRVTVELVVHGAGLGLLTKKGTRFAEELEQLHGLYGVSYTACSNTMKAMNVARADLIDHIERTVPAMVRLMELQEAGWAYIKP